MSNNNIIDALIYSSMKNIIEFDDWDKKYSELQQINSIDMPSEVNNLLTNSTIKRACCLKKRGPGGSNTYEIDLKIPVPKGMENSISGLSKKYGYINKKILVPVSMCQEDRYVNYNGEQGGECDDFFKVYCLNVLDDFSKISGTHKDFSKFDNVEFNKYSPECACFAPLPKNLPEQAKKNPQCWLPGCDKSSGAYQLSDKREICPQNIQQCIQQVTTNIGNVGGKANLSYGEMVNNCSQNITTNSASGKTSSESTRTVGNTSEIAKSSTPTQQPTVQQPTVQQPTVQQPIVQQPIVQQPIKQTTQQPTAQQPTTQPTGSNNTIIISAVVLFIIIFIVIIIMIRRK
jgi:hypothetical protein